MSIDNFKKDIVAKYTSEGADKFYRFLLFAAIKKMAAIESGNFQGPMPNLEYLEYYEQLIISYRREGEEIYLDIAKVFRRAAHKIYRVMLKKNLTARNDKFLNLV